VAPSFPFLLCALSLPSFRLINSEPATLLSPSKLFRDQVYLLVVARLTTVYPPPRSAPSRVPTSGMRWFYFPILPSFELTRGPSICDTLRMRNGAVNDMEWQVLIARWLARGKSETVRECVCVMAPSEPPEHCWAKTRRDKTDEAKHRK